MTQINPLLLDIEKRDSDFAVFYDGRPLKTPAGSEVSHHDPGLLECVVRDLCASGTLSCQDLNAYSVFITERDLAPANRESFIASVQTLLENDPAIMRKFKKQDTHSEDQLDSAVQTLEEQAPIFPMYFSGISGVARYLSEFIIEQTQGKTNLADCSPADFARAACNTFNTINPTGLAVTMLLSQAHSAGIMLPMLVALERITPSEYANALTSLRPVASSGISILPQIQRMNLDWSKPLECFRTIREQACRVTDYARASGRTCPEHTGAKSLISAGESFSVEFKSSLRWNIRAEKKDPAIEHASLKTLAAFLNSSGGTLLIGVRDDGSIEGIETDMFPDTDKFSLHFWNLAQTAFGQDACPFIKTGFEKIDGKTVCIAQATPSSRPVFLKNKNEEEFYIRIGPSSAKLGIREALAYIASRFEG